MKDERLPRSFGPYLLFEVLGAGGAGAVYAARSRDPARTGPLVVKLLHPAVASIPMHLMRFRQEAELAMRIDHPNVIKVFDAGTLDDQPYLAMEYVVGWTCSEVIQAVVRIRNGLPIPIAVGIVRQALEGLSAIHGLDLVHRDLSPNNVMIDAGGVVRLIDLGLAKSHLRDWKTRTGTTMGSPGYMPPEQIVGDDVGQRADFYPLGALLFELITAHRMVTGNTPFEILRAALEHRHRAINTFRADAGTAIDDVVRAATQFDPERRFESCAAFIAALDRACPDRAGPKAIELALSELVAERREERTRVVERSRTIVPAPPPRPARSGWIAPASAGLAVGLAIGGGTVAAWTRPRAAQTAEVAVPWPKQVEVPVQAEAPRAIAIERPASSDPPQAKAAAKQRSRERPALARETLPPAPVRAPSIKSRREALLERAKALRAERPQDPALLEALKELAMISDATDPARAEETLARIARQLAGTP